MCGIVGLYLKDEQLRPKLGEMFRPMLSEMRSRGPDSAGVAVYRNPVDSQQIKFSLAHDSIEFDWQALGSKLATGLDCSASIEQIDTHAILITDAAEQSVRHWLRASDSSIRIVGSGSSLEIFKEVGLPDDVYDRFNLDSANGYTYDWTHPNGYRKCCDNSWLSSVRHWR